MKEKIIKVLAPATVANVACGFDVLGFALSDINDELVMKIVPKKGVTIINKDTFNLPTETLALYCSEHKKENMININAKYCIEVECMKTPYYNLPKEKKAIYCSFHKKESYSKLT